MSFIKVSLVQPKFEGWDFDRNLAKCEKMVKKVLVDKPDLICLPELFPGRILKHSDFLWNLEVPIFFGHTDKEIVPGDARVVDEYIDTS